MIGPKGVNLQTFFADPTSAVAGYVELGEFDVSIKLVDGLRIATLHCKLEGVRP